jgi:hypothetical protein
MDLKKHRVQLMKTNYEQCTADRRNRRRPFWDKSIVGSKKKQEKRDRNGFFRSAAFAGLAFGGLRPPDDSNGGSSSWVNSGSSSISSPFSSALQYANGGGSANGGSESNNSSLYGLNLAEGGGEEVGERGEGGEGQETQHHDGGRDQSATGEAENNYILKHRAHGETANLRREKHITPQIAITETEEREEEKVVHQNKDKTRIRSQRDSLNVDNDDEANSGKLTKSTRIRSQRDSLNVDNDDEANSGKLTKSSRIKSPSLPALTSSHLRQENLAPRPQRQNKTVVHPSLSDKRSASVDYLPVIKGNNTRVAMQQKTSKNGANSHSPTSSTSGWTLPTISET